jgi:hypothetical protein
MPWAIGELLDFTNEVIRGLGIFREHVVKTIQGIV